MSETKPEFGKWRAFFWPVHGYELKKVLPMFLIFFLISFNYTVLRDAKDSIVVSKSGAETIPFLKVWVVVPFAALFMVWYAKMSNVLSKPKLFYTALVPFIIFFALFGTVLYPNTAYLHPHASADRLQAFFQWAIPFFDLTGLVSVYRYWTNSLFYVMAELWGTVGISLLFWGFANDITRTTEAKRFYTLFGLGANLALIVSGEVIKRIARMEVAPGVDQWGVSLNYMMTAVLIATLLTMAIYGWMQKEVLTDTRFYNPAEVKGKKEKPSMGLKESFAYIFNSKYLMCIATLVIAYGMSINLIEVTWKAQLKLQYPTENEYAAFMGGFSQFVGLATIIMMLFISGNIIRRFGWGVAAMITPVTLFVTGIGFFAFILFRGQLGGLVAIFNTTPLMLAVVFGTIQNVMSKSAKYSLFDPTKEMAYIPLDQEAKVKGKAAIDVVGARLGKSGGSFVQQLLIGKFGTISNITPYVGGILFFVIGAWIVAARSLSKQYAIITGSRTDRVS